MTITRTLRTSTAILTLTAGLAAQYQLDELRARHAPDPGSGALSIAAGDFNGDGLPDLAIGLYDRVAIYLNTPPTFTERPGAVPPTYGGFELVAADANGDGVVDLTDVSLLLDTVEQQDGSKDAETIRDLTGAKSELVFRPLPADDPKRRQPNIDKAKADIGWAPKVDLRAGLGKTISYFDDLIRSEE